MRERNKARERNRVRERERDTSYDYKKEASISLFNKS